MGESPDVIYYRRAFTPNYGLYLEEFLKHVADIFNTKNIYDQRMFTARKGVINLSVPEAQVRDNLFVLLCGSLEDHRKTGCCFKSKE